MPCCMKQKSHKNGVARRGWFGGGSVLTEVLISETVIGNVSVDTISFFAHSSFLIFYSKKEFKHFGNWERCGKTSPSGMFVHFFFEIAFIVLVAQIVKGTNKEKHFASLLNSIKMCSLIREIWGAQFLDTFMKRKDVQVAIRPKLFSHGT